MSPAKLAAEERLAQDRRSTELYKTMLPDGPTFSFHGAKMDEAMMMRHLAKLAGEETPIIRKQTVKDREDMRKEKPPEVQQWQSTWKRLDLGRDEQQVEETKDVKEDASTKLPTHTQQSTPIRLMGVLVDRISERDWFLQYQHTKRPSMRSAVYVKSNLLKLPSQLTDAKLPSIEITCVELKTTKVSIEALGEAYLRMLMVEMALEERECGMEDLSRIYQCIAMDGNPVESIETRDIKFAWGAGTQFYVGTILSPLAHTKAYPTQTIYSIRTWLRRRAPFPVSQLIEATPPSSYTLASFAPGVLDDAPPLSSPGIGHDCTPSLSHVPSCITLPEIYRDATTRLSHHLRGTSIYSYAVTAAIESVVPLAPQIVKDKLHLVLWKPFFIAPVAKIVLCRHTIDALTTDDEFATIHRLTAAYKIHLGALARDNAWTPSSFGSATHEASRYNVFLAATVQQLTAALHTYLATLPRRGKRTLVENVNMPAPIPLQIDSNSNGHLLFEQTWTLAKELNYAQSIVERELTLEEKITNIMKVRPKWVSERISKRVLKEGLHRLSETPEQWGAALQVIAEASVGVGIMDISESWGKVLTVAVRMAEEMNTHKPFKRLNLGGEAEKEREDKSTAPEDWKEFQWKTRKGFGDEQVWKRMRQQAGSEWSLKKFLKQRDLASSEETTFETKAMDRTSDERKEIKADRVWVDKHGWSRIEHTSKESVMALLERKQLNYDLAVERARALSESQNEASSAEKEVDIDRSEKDENEDEDEDEASKKALEETPATAAHEEFQSEQAKLPRFDPENEMSSETENVPAIQLPSDQKPEIQTLSERDPTSADEENETASVHAVQGVPEEGEKQMNDEALGEEKEAPAEEKGSEELLPEEPAHQADPDLKQATQSSSNEVPQSLPNERVLNQLVEERVEVAAGQDGGGCGDERMGGEK